MGTDKLTKSDSKGRKRGHCYGARDITAETAEAESADAQVEFLVLAASINR